MFSGHSTCHFLEDVESENSWIGSFQNWPPSSKLGCYLSSVNKILERDWEVFYPCCWQSSEASVSEKSLKKVHLCILFFFFFFLPMCCGFNWLIFLKHSKLSTFSYWIFDYSEITRWISLQKWHNVSIWMGSHYQYIFVISH